MELEVCWHGGAWRDIPRPVLATGPRVIERWSVATPDATVRERVDALLDAEWRSAAQVVAVMPDCTSNEIAVVLLRLVRAGIAERQPGRSQGGRRPFLYRRRGTV